MTYWLYILIMCRSAHRLYPPVTYRAFLFASLIGIRGYVWCGALCAPSQQELPKLK
ncbi:MAG: hypothetical protein J6N92_03595 [Alloprevotella sp.]|nr:hypothetical protein [Alloprevotella sp.]